MKKMKIGLISDTHNNLPEDVTGIFRDVDFILHAGDIGSADILQRLKQIAPTEAVYGNTDIYSIASTLPSKQSIKLEGLNFLLLHNVGNIKNFAWKIKREDFTPVPDVVVFGHTHRPFFQEYFDCIFINPGSAGLPRGGIPASVMILELQNGIILEHHLIRVKQN